VSVTAATGLATVTVAVADPACVPDAALAVTVAMPGAAHTTVAPPGAGATAAAGPLDANVTVGAPPVWPLTRTVTGTLSPGRQAIALGASDTSSAADATVTGTVAVPDCAPLVAVTVTLDAPTDAQRTVAVPPVAVTATLAFDAANAKLGASPAATVAPARSVTLSPTTQVSCAASSESASGDGAATVTGIESVPVCAPLVTVTATVALPGAAQRTVADAPFPSTLALAADAAYVALHVPAAPPTVRLTGTLCPATQLTTAGLAPTTSAGAAATVTGTAPESVRSPLVTVNSTDDVPGAVHRTVALPPLPATDTPVPCAV
jgi:hypothetical protein